MLHVLCDQGLIDHVTKNKFKRIRFFLQIYVQKSKDSYFAGSSPKTTMTCIKGDANKIFQIKNVKSKSGRPWLRLFWQCLSSVEPSVQATDDQNSANKKLKFLIVTARSLQHLSLGGTYKIRLPQNMKTQGLCFTFLPSF